MNSIYDSVMTQDSQLLASGTCRLIMSYKRKRKLEKRGETITQCRDGLGWLWWV